VTNHGTIELAVLVRRGAEVWNHSSLDAAIEVAELSTTKFGVCIPSNPFFSFHLKRLPFIRYGCLSSVMAAFHPL
jgi:hypothetical protein